LSAFSKFYLTGPEVLGEQAHDLFVYYESLNPEDARYELLKPFLVKYFKKKLFSGFFTRSFTYD